MRSTLALVLKLALIVGTILLGALPAWGQGPLPPPPSPWSFEVTPYLWAAGLHGDLRGDARRPWIPPSRTS